MKKLYSLAVAAIMSLGAFAQNGAPLYCCGTSPDMNWDAPTPVSFTYANGEYTLKASQLSMFTISTAKGGWDDVFKPNALTCNYGKTPGVKVPLTKGDANILCPWEGDYTITVAGDLSTITLTTTTPNPGGYTAVYLRGDMNNWGTDAAWKMSTNDGITYTFTCADGQSIGDGVAFKFADAGWASINYGASSEISLDEEVTLNYNGGNTTLDEIWNGSVTITIPAPQAAATVKFTNEKAGINDIVADDNAPAVYYNLQGVRVDNPEHGLFIQVKGNKAKKVVK